MECIRSLGVDGRVNDTITLEQRKINGFNSIDEGRCIFICRVTLPFLYQIS